MNSPAIISPGVTPANHSCPTGCRAIMAYNTKTMEGGTKMPKEDPA